MVSGRKPGLRADAVGSVARLRVRLAAGLSTWAHIGYLQSWRREMADATVTCEAPCACDRVSLEGHSRSERTSVTKIRALQVHSATATRGGSGRHGRTAPAAVECVLRLEVVPGAAGGARFVVSDLITGSANPGPLTWAFDVAGSLLLRDSKAVGGQSS